jgi:hypothetical protein
MAYLNVIEAYQQQEKKLPILSSSAFKQEIYPIFWNNNESVHFKLKNFSSTKIDIIHKILYGSIKQYITGENYYEAIYNNYKYIIRTTNQTSYLNLIYKIPSNLNEMVSKLVKLRECVFMNDNQNHEILDNDFYLGFDGEGDLCTKDSPPESDSSPIEEQNEEYHYYPKSAVPQWASIGKKSEKNQKKKKKRCPGTAFYTHPEVVPDKFIIQPNDHDSCRHCYSIWMKVNFLKYHFDI